MFFTEANFKDILRPDEARTIAKVCNALIDSHGLVLYGNAFDDDSASNFSSDKHKADTHVGILIGLSEMGIFESGGKSPKKDKPSDEDLVALMRDRQKVLERENRTLRSKQDGQ